MSYTKNKSIEKAPPHEHSWYKGSDLSEMKCVCGGVLISAGEFERRKQAWKDYFDKVHESRAYLRFKEQKEALLKGDLATVKRLAAEAKEDLNSKTDWIEKPHFPDTDWQHYYVTSDGQEPMPF